MTQANGILEQFNMACNYAKHAGPNTRTVLLLDEVILCCSLCLIADLLSCVLNQSISALDLAGVVRNFCDVLRLKLHHLHQQQHSSEEFIGDWGPCLK